MHTFDRPRRAVALFLAMVLTMSLAACGGNDDGDDNGDAAPAATTTTQLAGDQKVPKGEQPPVTDEPMLRKVTLRIRGAKSVTLDDNYELRFVVREGTGDWRPYSAASVTWVTPVDLGDKKAVNPEIAVVGMYDGDGDFTLPAGIGPSPTVGSTVPKPASDTESISVAQATFIDFAAQSDKRYGYLAEPCKVTLKAKATEGKATCPALVALDGERISLEFTWGPPD